MKSSSNINYINAIRAWNNDPKDFPSVNFKGAFAADSDVLSLQALASVLPPLP